VGELGLEIGLDEELSPLYDELRFLSLRAGAARSSGRGPGGGPGGGGRSSSEVDSKGGRREHLGSSQAGAGTQQLAPLEFEHLGSSQAGAQQLAPLDFELGSSQAGAGTQQLAPLECEHSNLAQAPTTVSVGAPAAEAC